MRDFWRVSDFYLDLRHAFRLHRNTPIASTVAVLALALGIGVNTSAFIPVWAIILNPLPYRPLDRIVSVSESAREAPAETVSLTPADFLDVQAASRSFEKLAAYEPSSLTLAAGGEIERIEGCHVSPRFFDVLGIAPLLGRTLCCAHPLDANAGEVVVSESFWRSHLEGTTALKKVSIVLDGQRVAVAGVMPDHFDIPLAAQVWVPFALETSLRQDRATHRLSVIGLLRPDVTPEQANTEVAALANRLETAYPLTNRGRSITAVPLRVRMTEHITDRFLIMLFGAAIFVLLLACANVGNLQLARAAMREKEIAVRSALGATRSRIFRQLFAESVLLSLAAGLVALLLANWYLAWGKSRISPTAFHYVPGLRTMTIDWNVAFFTLLLSLIAGLLCSVPGMIELVGRTRAPESSEALRGKASSLTTPGRNRLRSALIISELALSMVLLVGAGLMVKTFQRLLLVNQGFDPRNVLTLRVSLPPADGLSGTQSIGFYDRALDRFRVLPGVAAAGLFARQGLADQFQIEGHPEPAPGGLRPAVTVASPGYFASIRIGLLQGRGIASGDRPDSPLIAVISRSVARHYWPAGDALGHRIRVGPAGKWLTIVGVSTDIVEDWLTGVPAPQIYIPYSQQPAAAAEFVLRTHGDPSRMAGMARRALAAVDPAIPAFDVLTMQRALAQERGGIRAAAVAMTGYAFIALILATTGICAVVSYFVTARTHDIGIHIALGADRGDVFAMIMGRAIILTALGLAVGLPMAFVLARGMSSLLYNIVALTPATFCLFAFVLVASALLASYIPARRAARIDPLIALRDE
ncbi:MAG TPA: ABC transporter permease [Bryobacteraceae bacterium]|nr:ABC transporter permease [Bryobacteraceae bacterium]